MFTTVTDTAAPTKIEYSRTIDVNCDEHSAEYPAECPQTQRVSLTSMSVHSQKNILEK